MISLTTIMNLEHPWDAMQIELIVENRTFQYYDSDIYILYLLSGYAHVSFEDQLLHLSSDDFVILPKGVCATLTIDEGNVFLYRIKYSFPIDKLNKYYYVFTGDSVQNGSSKTSTVIRILQKLMQSTIFKYERPRSRVLQYYFELISVLEENFCIKRSFDTQGSIYQKIEALGAYIRNNSENEMRLRSIAEQLFVSEQYLSKMFRKINHESLSDYIVRCRMEHVIDMLQTTDLTITDIAFSAGFTNINSFNRLFKNRFHQTPKEYRSQWSTEKAKKVEEQEKDVDAIKHLLKEEELSDKEIRICLHEQALQKQNVPFLIGAGDVYRLSEEPMFAQFQQIDQLKTAYIRLTGWLRKDPFDFVQIELILDTCIKKAYRPYIEFDISDYLHQPDRLTERITLLYEDWIKNYGQDQLKHWMIAIVIDHEINELSSQEAQLFYTSYQMIHTLWKERIPEGSVGIGQLRADLAYAGFLQDFLSLPEQSHPDFCAITMYQVDQHAKADQSELMEGKTSPDPGFMKRKLVELKQAIPPSQTKLIVVDFNVVGIDQLDIMNDSIFKGTYILKNMVDLMKECDMIGYGSLLDQMYRKPDQKNEIFGAPGLLSLHGFKKAGYMAIQFLSSICLKPIAIHKDTIIGIDTSKKHISLLMFHYSHLGVHYYYNTMKFHRYNINKAFEKQKELVYHVDVSQLLCEEKVYKASITTYGIGKGSLLEEINQYSHDDILTTKDIEYLNHKIQPSKTIDHLHKDHMIIDIKIKSHEMVYIEIEEMTPYSIG